MQLGIPYVEFSVPRDTVSGIARFYERIIGCRTRCNQTYCDISVGQEQFLRFREKSNVPAYDGHHIAIYVSNFSEPHAYLKKAGIQAFVGGRKRYSTDANLAGISYEAEDLESLKTPSTIVEPQMGVWPQDAPDRVQKVTVVFRKGRAVSINGRPMMEAYPLFIAASRQRENSGSIWMSFVILVSPVRTAVPIGLNPVSESSQLT